jgi:hypothetical protein
MNEVTGCIGDPAFLERFKPELLRRFPQARVTYSVDLLEQWRIDYLFVVLTRPCYTTRLTVRVWDLTEVLGPGLYGPPYEERNTIGRFDLDGANAIDAIEEWIRKRLNSNKTNPPATP